MHSCKVQKSQTPACLPLCIVESLMRGRVDRHKFYFKATDCNLLQYWQDGRRSNIELKKFSQERMLILTADNLLWSEFDSVDYPSKAEIILLSVLLRFYLMIALIKINSEKSFPKYICNFQLLE